MSANPFLSVLSHKLNGMNARQRRQRMKEMQEESPGGEWTIEQVLEWICLSQNMNPWEAEKDFREKMASGAIPWRFA